MESPKRSAEPPVYGLCPLIPNINLGAEEERDRTEIRCVAALGRHIYLGCSDGKLMSYKLEDSIDVIPRYTLTKEITLKSRSSIISLQLAPSLSKAIVLSDDTISFLSLPDLDPVPSDVMRSMKNALSFTINETPSPQEPVGLAIVKRSGISFWEMGNKLHFLKELPAVGIMHARRTGPTLCVADPETYMIIDLASSNQIPLHPISLSPTWKILPKIEVSKSDEYLMVACTGTSDDFSQVFSMGLLVNGRAEPTQSPIEWKTTPECICVEGELVLSLHLDLPVISPSSSGRKTQSVVEVRKPGGSGILQSLSLPSTKGSGDVHLMTLARDGFAVPVNSRLEKLLLVSVQLSRQKEAVESKAKSSRKPDVEGSKLDEPIGSGLTPPPTPKKPTRPSSRGNEHTRTGSQGRNVMQHVPGSVSGPVRFPTSRILLATRNSVYALVPLTLLSQVEQMLEDGKAKDAAAFLAQAQAKHAKDEALVADFRYLNLRIGIAYMFQTAFEDAGDALFRGELDPRWLMGLWEEWATVIDKCSRGTSPMMVEIFSGLQPALSKLRDTTIRQIVANYSPHLKPSTAQSTAGQELQATLEWSAREMLTKYLRKFRTRRQFVGEEMGGMYTDDMVNRAIDTVSALLYVEATDPDGVQELRSLLDDSPFISLEDVREALIENGHIASLAKMYERRNDQPSLMELYVKVADGIWKDDSISDPISKVRKLLQSSKDRSLVYKHGLWLLKRDRSSGLKLLISAESKRPTSAAEDAELLARIREVDARASIKFLEYLVLQRKTLDSSLHTQLVTSYLDDFVQFLEEPKVAEAQRAAIDGYLTSASRPSRPFLFHLAFETPDSDHKRVRLKLALMLQGSNSYDLETVRRKLRVQETNLKLLLCLEMAIIDAKVGDHKSALSVLVNDLQDFTTAEAYCSLGGRVITPKIAAAIGDRMNLGDWAALVLSLDAPGGSINGIGRVRRQGSSSSLNVNGTRGGPSPDASSPSEPRKAVELTKMLLEVYMKAGESRATEASRLLNAQAVNFEAADIIPQMPSGWSLGLVSSFLSRSFRRSLHDVYEGQILKQLSAGQNLQTSEMAFEAFAAAGAMIEESNGEEKNGEDSDREESNEDEIFATNELKELSSQIHEKLAEKRLPDHADTRPGDIRARKPDQ